MKKMYALAFASILFWSTVATVSKILLGSFSQYQLLCVSTFFAAVALFVFNLVTGKLKCLKNYSPKYILLIVATGLCGNFFYYVFYYSGTRLMPTSTAFVVNYLWPIMSVLFASIILKEKFTLRKAIALAVSFIGVAVISGKELFEYNSNMLLGTLFCIIGAMFYGAFTAFNKKYRFDMPVSMMISFTASFVLSLIINLAIGTDWSMGVGEILGFAWNGVFSMATGGVCWAIALNNGNTAKISSLAYITPFLSLFWVFLFLKEPISATTLIGFAIIVLGIFIQIKDGRKRGDTISR